MKLCHECEGEVPSSAMVCGYCGTRLAGSATAQPDRPVVDRPAPVQAPPVAVAPDDRRRRLSWAMVTPIVLVVGALAIGGIKLLGGSGEPQATTAPIAATTTTAAATTTEAPTTTRAATTTTAAATTTEAPTTTRATTTTATAVQYASMEELPGERLDLLPYRGMHQCTVVGTIQEHDLDVEDCSGEMTGPAGGFHVAHGGDADSVEFFIINDDGDLLHPDGSFDLTSDAGTATVYYFLFPEGLSGQVEMTGVWFFDGWEWVISRTVVNFP